MSARGRAQIAFALAGVAAMAVGCTTAPPGYDEAALARETFTANHPGMVLGGPAARTGAVDDTPPWWFSRNDGRLNIREAPAGGQYEATRVDVRDRQISRPGRIHDSYRRTVRSSRFDQRVR